MFCTNCGFNVPEGSRFCPHCGMSVGPEAPSRQAYDFQGNATPGAQDGPPQPGIDVYRPQASSQTYAGQGVYQGPRHHMRTDRSLAVYILLTILTCGIYGYWYVYQLALDANEMCAQDGEETPGLALYLLLSIATCGIYSYYWEYKLGNRLQANAPHYGITISTSGSDILMWRLLGALICFIGTFYGTYLLFQSANELSRAYNRANNLM